MRILQVVHCFLPESMGGTEVYTYLLSKALQARHDVAIYYRIVDQQRPESALSQGSYDGIPVFRVVNNFSWSPGPEFDFFCPGVEATFEQVVDSTRPDIVHFEHLADGLSTSLPRLVRRRGIPMLLTLHDFWYMCPRSHLLTSDGQLCPGPEDGLRCAQCWLDDHGGAAVKPSPQRLRELGLRNVLRRLPNYFRNLVFPPQNLPRMFYHTMQLMLRDGYFRRLLAGFDILLSPSRFLMERFVDWGLPPDRVKHIPNGIDSSKFHDLGRDLPMGENLQAIYAGAIQGHKGLDILIDAFNQLIEAPVELRIYGNTESTSQIKQYAQSLHAQCRNPRVTFAGVFPNDQIGQVMSGADFVIVPSIWYENCPMIILEALHAGRPVIASNIGGMAELVQDGVNGLTFRVGDAGHLAGRIRFLCENRDALLTYQSKIVPPLTMEAVAARVEACYEELLRERQAGEPGL